MLKWIKDIILGEPAVMTYHIKIISEDVVRVKSMLDGEVLASDDLFVSVEDKWVHDIQGYTVECSNLLNTIKAAYILQKLENFRKGRDHD